MWVCGRRGHASSGRQPALLGRQQLTQAHAYPVNVLVHWRIGETEPWLWATNLPSLKEALRAYEIRIWIEEMLGDLKDNGFDLESTHLRATMKLHRLTLAVVLLYVELVTAGAKVVKASLRHLIDRADRRDLSYLRIGLYMRDRHLANSHPFLFAANRSRVAGIQTYTPLLIFCASKACCCR